MASRMRQMKKCMRLQGWLTVIVSSLHSQMATIPTLAKPHWLSLVDKSKGLRLQGKNDFRRLSITNFRVLSTHGHVRHTTSFPGLS
mmetsp:Transcript_15143/g.32137  ORF Transcript_15143/g.32137 Transcript_15143/m.32137 type:complete len:86 (-) Transcript_15143:1722-1979(-)